MSPTLLFFLQHSGMISMWNVSVTAIVGHGHSGDKISLFLVLSFKIIFKFISFVTLCPNSLSFYSFIFSSFPFPSSSLLFLLSQLIFSFWIIPQLNLDQPSAALRCYPKKTVGVSLIYMILFYLRQEFPTMK